MAENIYSEVQSLIKLLDDSSSNVADLAHNRLVELGSAAYPVLLDHYLDYHKPELKETIHVILREIRLNRLHREILEIGTTDDINELERLAFRIAQLEYPSLNLINYKVLLDQMSVKIRDYVTVNSSKMELIQGMNWYLFNKYGLGPNRNNYYDPQNSYLNRVLDRKKGIPVTMSVIYMLVADRLGFKLRGVGLPGHFLLTDFKKPGKFYLDVYNSGKLLTTSDCQKIVERAGVTFDEKYLQPVHNRDILSRILRNLMYAFKREENDEQHTFYESLVHLVEN